MTATASRITSLLLCSIALGCTSDVTDAGPECSSDGPAIGAGCSPRKPAAAPDDPLDAHFEGTVQVDGELLVHSGRIRLIANQLETFAPEIRWYSKNGEWATGIDTANLGGPRDFVVAAKVNWPSAGLVNDLVYVGHNGEHAPTVGIGVTPPNRSHRLQLSAQDDEPEMGTLQLRRSPAQTGNLLTAIDSAGAPRWWLDSDFWLKGSSVATEASVSIKADDQRGRPLALAKSDGSTVYGFQYAPDASGALDLRYMTGGVTLMTLQTNGRPEFPNGLAASSLHIDSPAPPATSSSPCTRGEIRYDDSFVYVCVATDTWKRSALSSW